MRPIAPVTIHLIASRRLLLLQAAAHVLAGLAIMSAEIPGWLAALLLAAVGASLSHVRRPLPFPTLVLGGDGILQKVGADEPTKQQGGRAKDALLAVANDGTAIELQLDSGTMVLPQLVVLRWRRTPLTRAGGLALLKDSMRADDFRRLRVWLRWRATLGNASPAETAS